MNMMLLGSQNGGGRSSSSSSLSPLASPFTLDKPYHKQRNPNPPVIFTAQPYGHRFDLPTPVWTPSINAPFGPNFTENSSKDCDSSPLDVHGFPGCQSNKSSLSSHLGPSSSAVTSGYDGIPYGQCLHSVPGGLVEAKPYYPPHVGADDRNLVALNEPSYDLLSNFGVGQLRGSSRVDDKRNMSTLEYTPQWNGLNDVEQGNWLDLGGNFCSKEYKPSDSSIGQKYMKKGPDAGGDRFDFHAGILPIGSFGLHAETSIKLTNCFDGFGGENNFGCASIGNHKSFKAPNPGATNACIRVSATGPTSACGDKHTKYTDLHVFDSASTMNSSPANMTKMTFGGFPSPQDALPSPPVNAMSNEATDKIEKSSDFLAYHPFSLRCQVSNHTGSADSLFTRSSSTKMGDNLIPHLSVTDCLKMKSDTADTFYSMEKSSDGLDIQNLAEDSPCWKGVPAAPFFPFEDPKVVTTDDVSEELESRFNVKSEEHKNSPIRLDTADTMHVTGELDEKSSAKRSFDADYVSRECDVSHSAKQRFHRMKLYGGDAFQSLDKRHGLDLGIGNEFSLLNYSEVASSSKSSQSLQINSEECKVVPEEKLALTVAEVKGKCPDAPSSDRLSCAPTNAGDHLLCSPSGNVAASKDDQPSGKDSNSRLGISVLVNAMKSLSELLVSHCSNNHAKPTELDCATLEQIIGNLNSCLVKEADQVTQMEKAWDPYPAQTSKCSYDYGVINSQVRKGTAAHTDHPGVDILVDRKRDIFHSGNDSLLDTYFLKENAEPVRDTNTIQAIKRVLDMNFPSEEMQPETILYKNLWLEAEAALCAITVRSRVHCMKVEMEKRKHHWTKDEENVPISMASDENKVAELPHETKSSPCSSKHIHPTEPSVSPQSRANDVEASVMDRFQILKSREDNSDSYFSSLASCKDDVEASVMSRFNVLKTRIEHSEPPDIDTQQLLGRVDGPTWTSFFSTEGENVKAFSGASMASNLGKKPCKVDGIKDELFEGWYDCSESGWEHIIKEGCAKQN